MNINSDEPTSQPPIIELRGVTVSFGPHDVVRNANLTVSPGETVGLVGESGSGKTMLCRAAVGLLGSLGGAVTEGAVCINGETVEGNQDSAWRKYRGHTLGLVPQASLAGLDPIMRIGAQLKETIRRLDREARPKARALELLQSVRIRNPEEVMNAYPHQLSGGMRQRVMIALALAGRPALIVADEATTALDATVQKSVLMLIRDIQRETNMALLLVTHDLSIVRQMTDRMYVMSKGEIVESGNTEPILAAPQHRYTRALFAADPSQQQVSRS